MRILHVHNFYETTGGECNVVRAERALLQDAGHELITLDADSAAIRDWGGWQRTLAVPRVVFNPGVDRKLSRVLGGRQPDVAHVHNVFPLLSPAIYLALRRRKIPIVQTVHNYRFLCPNGLMFANGQICEACPDGGSFWPAVRKACFRSSRLLSALYAASVQTAWSSGAILAIDRYVALSRFLADKLAGSGIPRERIRIQGNFFDAGSLPAIADTAKQPYVAFVGRLSPEKGLNTLLQALRACPDVPCKLAGDGPLREELRRQLSAPDLRHVEYLGYLGGEAKQRLITQAAAVIVPTESYENCSMTVIESLSMGTAVVASQIGGLPELVENGATGWLFPPGNVTALSHVLRQAVGDLATAAKMGRNAKGLSRERFNPARHLNDICRIYDELKISPDGFHPVPR